MGFAESVIAMDDCVRQHLGSQDAIYSPHPGYLKTITGIFDKNYVLVDQGAGYGVEQSTPAFWANLADVPEHPDDVDPTLTIKGVDYIVRERKHDGSMGNTILLLLHVKHV